MPYHIIFVVGKHETTENNRLEKTKSRILKKTKVFVLEALFWGASTQRTVLSAMKVRN